MIKIKRYDDRLIIIMGISIFGKMAVILNQGPGDTYIRQWTASSLAQVPEAMLIYHRLDTLRPLLITWFNLNPNRDK